MGSKNGKDWTRDLDSIRRQNVKLLAEREAYRDTVRALRERERNYQRRLEELWAICTDVRMCLARIHPVEDEDDGWAKLPDEVRHLAEEFVKVHLQLVKAEIEVDEWRKKHASRWGSRLKRWLRRKE